MPDQTVELATERADVAGCVEHQVALAEVDYGTERSEHADRCGVHGPSVEQVQAKARVELAQKGAHMSELLPAVGRRQRAPESLAPGEPLQILKGHRNLDVAGGFARVVQPAPTVGDRLGGSPPREIG